MATLFEALNQEEVRYCQWKSTPRLPEAKRGETDFDLLVDRGHIRLFKPILYRLDFKPIVSRSSNQFPAIENYLGFDRSSGRLIHLHVYYRLILGDHYVKNYALPLERGFLDSVELRDGVKVPSPELEIIVLVLRTLLKYRDRDVLRGLLGRDPDGGLSPALLGELRWLRSQTDIGRVADVLKQDAAFIAPSLVLGFLTVVEKSPRDGWKLDRLRQWTRRELAPFQRESHPRAQARYYWRVLTQEGPFRRVTRRLWDAEDKAKFPQAGGLTVAFVGADGAGKSTVVRQIAGWLSWKLHVRTYYMGAKQPSISTGALEAVNAVASISFAGCRRLLGETNPCTKLMGSVREVTTCVHFLAQAIDRLRRYQSGRRQAGQGSIVVYDRYPLLPSRPGMRTMDGPRVASLGKSHLGPIGRRFSLREERLYQQVQPVDHYFVMHVNPDVALRRKPEHRIEVLEEKLWAIEQMQNEGQSRTTIDANQPLDEVLLQIKAALWNVL